MATSEAPDSAPPTDPEASPKRTVSGLRRRVSSIDLDTRPYNRAEFEDLVSRVEAAPASGQAVKGMFDVPDFTPRDEEERLEVTVVAPPPFPLLDVDADEEEEQDPVITIVMREAPEMTRPPLADARDASPAPSDREWLEICLFGLIALVGIVSWSGIIALLASAPRGFLP
jgi:hypothetical protein